MNISKYRATFSAETGRSAGTDNVFRRVRLNLSHAISKNIG